MHRATIRVLIVVAKLLVVVVVTLQVLLLVLNNLEGILTDLHFTHSSELLCNSQYASQGISPQIIRT
jgi:hypothetical protein